MTREQEISKVALELEYASPYDAFMAGARWADQHPVNYDGNAMLYVCNKSHENGYKEAVDKACEWLESNCTHLVLMKGEYYDSKEIVEQFRKAMKGE